MNAENCDGFISLRLHIIADANYHFTLITLYSESKFGLCIKHVQITSNFGSMTEGSMENREV